MNTYITPDDIIAVVKSFLLCNEGDEPTEILILAIGAELLDVSIDKLLEMLQEE